MNVEARRGEARRGMAGGEMAIAGVREKGRTARLLR